MRTYNNDKLRFTYQIAGSLLGNNKNKVTTLEGRAAYMRLLSEITLINRMRRNSGSSCEYTTKIIKSMKSN